MRGLALRQPTSSDAACLPSERSNAKLCDHPSTKCNRFELGPNFIEGGEEIFCMSMKLYVGNLSFRTTSDELKQLFSRVGTVESATVVQDRETGRSRGFGFVEMASREEALKAIEEYNGKEVGGRTLTVNEAKQREERGGGRRRPR